MPKVMFLLALFVVVSESGCDEQKQDEQKQDVRISALEADVKQLKADVVELREKQKSKHHYELRNEGLRTWRFQRKTVDQLTIAFDSQSGDAAMLTLEWEGWRAAVKLVKQQ